MLCALCLKKAKLINSHIISEFLYKNLYDEKHRFHFLSTIPDTENRMEQKGLREHLLCEKCELKLSEWEHYASFVLNGGIALTVNWENNFASITGLDYSKFKLFQLSVLWRAGVSKLPFFKNVQLGDHLEIIRKLLLSNNPGSDLRYGCVMIGITYESEALTDLIMQPLRVYIQKNLAYRFVFCGIMWVMLVTEHNHSKSLSRLILNSKGSTILMIREAKEIQSLINFSKELKVLNCNLKF